MDQTSFNLTNKKSVILFYREQLRKFLKLGIGKMTEHNTIVTKKLIDCTRKRIVQLGGKTALDPHWGEIKIALPSINCEETSTARVRAFRKRQLERKCNGQLPSSNRTITQPRSKSDGSSRSNGDKSSCI